MSELDLEQYEEVERPANLYVASSQLNGTVELKEVVSVILEICVNLIGAGRVVIYMHDAGSKRFLPVASNLGTLPEEELVLGEGRVGEHLAGGRPVLPEGKRPAAIVPMTASGRSIGAVVLESLLPHKEGFTSLDYELLDLLGRQGAVALYGACLASAAAHEIRVEDVRSHLEAGS
ncbi:MAG: GAF domain-containing protein [Myxococcota bacterium]